MSIIHFLLLFWSADIAANPTPASGAFTDADAWEDIDAWEV